MSFVLISPAFVDGAPIPAQYSRDGANLSPPLQWTGAPPATGSFALIVEDPDAPSGVFRHWGAYNLPADRDELAEGVDARRVYADAVNDFGKAQYDGPQPPRGHGLHHYHFRLLALDAPRLDLPKNAKVADLLAAAKPHVLGEADLVGTYERQ
jgi:Raf kinase inhibitor-like YbhB/YbcL family protein